MITHSKQNRQHESTSEEPAKPLAKGLQPYTKSPVGNFTSSSSSPKAIIDKHAKIDARKCLVAQVGLENFIRNVVIPLNLQLPENVKFNMNGQGRLDRWDDVYLAERVYTRCLGISKRIYQTHASTHEPDKKLAYFILEERNERSLWFLPSFDFFVLVFTYYDEQRNVTRVDVQYDQMSFFLQCMGIAQAHAWLVESVITPLALIWARAYHASGLVNPFTFLLQLLILPIALTYWLLCSR